MKARVLAGWPTPPDRPDTPANLRGAGPPPYVAAVAFPMQVEETDGPDGPRTVLLEGIRQLHSWAERRFLFYRVLDLEIPYAAVVPEHLRVPEDATREAGRHAALAIQLLLPHRGFEDIRKAIEGLRDGILIGIEDTFPVTIAITERRDGPDWTYHLEHPDGRTIPLAEPEEMIAVAERLRPEDFRGLVSGKDVLRQARGVVLPAAVRDGTVIRLRSWPPSPLEL